MRGGRRTLMLTCKEVTELVTDDAQGNVSFVDRVRFRMHIGMCRNCRRYVRQVKAMVGALGLLPAPEMSAELEDQLLRRFERWTQTRGS